MDVAAWIVVSVFTVGFVRVMYLAYPLLLPTVTDSSNVTCELSESAPKVESVETERRKWKLENGTVASSFAHIPQFRPNLLAKD